MKTRTCTIRVKKTGQVITVKPYGAGWIDCKGNFWHRTTAELVNVHND